MQDNTHPTTAPVYNLPTVDEVGAMIQGAKQNGSVRQELAALSLARVHVELLRQRIEELPDKAAGEISAETPAA